MGWKSKAPAPDPAIGQAAAAQAAIAREQLTFAREQYADQKAEADRLAPMIDALMRGQVEMSDLTSEQNKLAFDDYKSMYRPNEARYMEDVAKAGSVDEQGQAALKAGVDVQRNLDTQRTASAQTMAAMGVNPASGKFAGGMRSHEIMGAAARAGAETAAAEGERQRGVAARAAAVGVGRGQAGLALQGVQVGNQTAQSATGVGGTTFGMNQAAGGAFMAGLGASAGTYGQSANTYLGLHGAQVAQANASNYFTGQILGAGATVAGAFF